MTGAASGFGSGTGTCRQSTIFPFTISNCAAASVPGASQCVAPRLPSRKTTVAKRPRIAIETTRPAHGRPECHWASCAYVWKRKAYEPWATIDGSANRRATAALSPAFRWLLQAWTMAFICRALVGEVAAPEGAADEKATHVATSASATCDRHVRMRRRLRRHGRRGSRGQQPAALVPR